MLSVLAVRNLGVIEAVEVELPRGLVALTGETGAGKTLVVTAIGLLLGDRARGELVGPGGDRASVRAIVEVDGSEVLLEREVSREGRARARIDGELASVGEVSRLAARAVQMVGQHESVFLTQPDAQRRLLDQAGGVDPRPFDLARERLSDLEAARARAAHARAAAERDRELLAYELAELEAASLEDPGEDERLTRLIERLADADELRGELFELHRALVGAGGIVQRLGTSGRRLGRGLPQLAARLDALAAEVADVADEARAAFEQLESDPDALASAQARLAALVHLKRRFGPTLPGVIEAREERRRRLGELSRGEAELAELDAQLEAARSRLEAEAATLRRAREVAAARLLDHVQGALGELGLERGRFAVDLAGPEGQATFLFASGPDLALLPLGRAASGGELSRLVLAMAELLGEGTEALVLDEIDTGLGGQAALGVATRLARLGRHRQVVVVTHTASIAAAAGTQFAVRKEIRGGRTRTHVERVEGEDRVREVARLLSGQPEAAVALEHARSLLATMARLASGDLPVADGANL